MILKKIYIVAIIFVILSCNDKNKRDNISNSSNSVSNNTIESTDSNEIPLMLKSVELVREEDEENINGKTNYEKYLKNNKDKIEIRRSSIEDYILYQHKKIGLDIVNIDTNKIRKNNGFIQLNLNNNEMKVFRDTLVNTDNSDFREYKYLGSIDTINQYLLVGYFWEYMEYYLVNKDNGEVTILWERPNLSPDNKYIVNLSMDYGLEFVPNGIQIWKVEKDGNANISINKHFELDQEIWVPSNLIWKSDNEFILKVASIEKFMENPNELKEEDYYHLEFNVKEE